MGLTSEEIIKKASHCLKKGVNKVSAEVAMGIAWYEMGDVEKAALHYQKALAAEPLCAEAHAGLGISLARAGDKEKSFLHLEQAWKLNQNCSLLANWLADACFDRGSLDRAIELYGEALRLNAADSNAQNDMADAFRLKGDHATAVEMYDRAISIDPGDTNAMLEKAQCLVQLKRPEEALKTMQTLISTFPASRDSATAMVVCGTILNRSGNYEEAGEWFERALEFFPFNRQVLFQAAMCAMNCNKTASCQKHLEQILEINPADERAAAMLQKVAKR